MQVENSKGETEVLIDYQSYQAGYRQAVCDLVTPQGVSEPKHEFSLLPILASALLLLALINFFEG